ncbi:hypothetical protein V6N13_129127 [Hibiscus sabdariffa]
MQSYEPLVVARLQGDVKRAMALSICYEKYYLVRHLGCESYEGKVTDVGPGFDMCHIGSLKSLIPVGEDDSTNKDHSWRQASGAEKV